MGIELGWLGSIGNWLDQTTEEKVNPHDSRSPPDSLEPEPALMAVEARELLPVSVSEWTPRDAASWAAAMFSAPLWQFTCNSANAQIWSANCDPKWRQELDLSAALLSAKVDGRQLVEIGPLELEDLAPGLGMHTKSQVLRAVRALHSRWWWSCISKPAEEGWFNLLFKR